MRLTALLMTAGLAVASAGTAAANPHGTCEGKTWLAELVCKAQQPATSAATSAAKPEATTAETAENAQPKDAWSMVRALLPRSAYDWFRDRVGTAASKPRVEG